MKRKILMLILANTIFMTSCMPATVEEKERIQKEKGEYVKEYDSIDDLDFSSGHIEGTLREKFSVDADVQIDYPKQCGTYELVRKNIDKTEEEYNEYFVNIVDGYFTEDNTVSWTVKHTLGEDVWRNTRYDGNKGVYFKRVGDIMEDYYSVCHSIVQTVERYFYEYGFEYDKELIDGVVNDFLEKCADIIPDGINGDYVCVHVDKEYMDYIIEKYGKEEKESFCGKRNMEYYSVILYPEIEENIYFKGYSRRYFELNEGETADEICINTGTNDAGKPWIATHTPQYVELIISEDGEVISFEIEDYYTIEECMAEYDIISPKKALEVFCDVYEGIVLERELIVRSIKLEYQIKVDEPNESGYRNAYLIPVWVIRYKSPLDYWSEYLDEGVIVSAIDGSVLVSPSDLY